MTVPISFFDLCQQLRVRQWGGDGEGWPCKPRSDAVRVSLYDTQLAVSSLGDKTRNKHLSLELGRDVDVGVLCVL